MESWDGRLEARCTRCKRCTPRKQIRRGVMDGRGRARDERSSSAERQIPALLRPSPRPGAPWTNVRGSDGQRWRATGPYLSDGSAELEMGRWRGAGGSAARSQSGGGGGRCGGQVTEPGSRCACSRATRSASQTGIACATTTSGGRRAVGAGY